VETCTSGDGGDSADRGDSGHSVTVEAVGNL
jgi:hypothetical protein